MKKAVAGIFRNNDNEFLLMYHNVMKAFTPPGGKFDPQFDISTMDTLKREMKEEIDIKINDDDIYKINTSVIYLDNMGNYILDTFFINSPNIIPINMEPEKHTGLGWYSLDDMKMMFSKSYSAKIIEDSHLCLDEYIEYHNRSKYTSVYLSL